MLLFFLEFFFVKSKFKFTSQQIANERWFVVGCGIKGHQGNSSDIEVGISKSSQEISNAISEESIDCLRLVGNCEFHGRYYCGPKIQNILWWIFEKWFNKNKNFVKSKFTSLKEMVRTELLVIGVAILRVWSNTIFPDIPQQHFWYLNSKK